eukprot:g5127.t2
MWLPSSSHRATRLSGSGRPAMAQQQYQQRMGTSNGYTSSTAGGGGRAGDFSREGSAGGDGCGGGSAGGGGRGRMSIPQRYNRSRERQDSNSSAGGGGGFGLARRASRHRNGGGGGGESTGGAVAGANGGSKLPSIGSGGGGGGKDGGGGVGGRSPYQKNGQQYGAGGGGGKQLVVHEEGSEHCGVCTIQGLKPNNPRWENQDNYVMKEDLGGLGIRLFVVLDGHGEISVANLGDSKCVLGTMVNGHVCAVALSDDHKPDRPDERQRILAIGGQRQE